MAARVIERAPQTRKPILAKLSPNVSRIGRWLAVGAPAPTGSQP
jgi:hypothetical protein